MASKTESISVKVLNFYCRKLPSGNWVLDRGTEAPVQPWKMMRVNGQFSR